MRRDRAKIRDGLIAALDVGTTKVCCFITKVENGRPRAVGVGHHGSRGVKSGVVCALDEAEQAILMAVHGAEQMAGEQIRGVVVNMSGGGPSSRTQAHEVSVGGKEIADGDIRRALEQARGGSEPADRVALHRIPVGFSIDGSRGIRDPRGMFGQRLGAHMHTVSVSASALKTLTACVARAHLEIDSVVVSPFAAGLSALVPDERDLGVTLIDMGGGCTTIAVFFDGQLVYADSVPIGGVHVTNDIARGLSTPLAHAERMKTLYGAAMVSAVDERETIEAPLVGEDGAAHANTIPKSLLTGVIQPRLEETFELVRSRLEASGYDKIAGRRAVLTGGASQLQGVRELAGMILDKQVRLGRPLGVDGLSESFTGPAFSTCAGLILHALQPAPSLEPAKRGRAEGPAPTGMFGRLGLWLRENF